MTASSRLCRRALLVASAWASLAASSLLWPLLLLLLLLTVPDAAGLAR
jgi:hypothetical protein